MKPNLTNDISLERASKEELWEMLKQDCYTEDFKKKIKERIHYIEEREVTVYKPTSVLGITPFDKNYFDMLMKC